MKPLNVLHVLRSPRAEGTVKLTLDWLQHPGLTQEVLVLDPAPPEMTECLREHASWLRLGDGLARGPGKYPRIVAEVWRTCRQRRPDLVICWINGFAPWVLAGARLAGVRRLITHAGNPPTLTAWGRMQTVLSTFTAWLSGGRMVCCSRFVAAQFARSPGAFASVLDVVYNCAPIEAISATAARARAARTDWRPRLIMVATLESHKDHATLLRAMPEVIRALPEVHLWLAGEGTLRGRLQELTASLGMGGAVTFLGSRNDVPALLGQSDGFVFSTTREEGLGTVLIEALAAGLPVVASDVPACREVLEDGRWGTLVPAANARALAEALVSLLRERRRPAPDAQSDYVARFTPGAMIAAYTRLHDAH